MAIGTPDRLARGLLYTQESGAGKATMRFVLARPISQRNLLAVLSLGFGLVMLLLLAAAAVAVDNTREIQADAEQLVREQALTARLMNQMRVEQTALNAVFYRLTSDPEDIDRGELLRQLDAAGESLERLARNAAQTPQAALFRELNTSAQAFSSEAKRLVMANQLSDNAIRGLFKLHDEVARVVRSLADASAERARVAESKITEHARELMHESIMLLGGCLLLAMVFAYLTVKASTMLFDRVEAQANELSRVSWQMLQGQEEAARRFSHELHDELGQALTALKTNLSSMTADNLAARRTDCLQLVHGAIGNVRELSQLLHPVILDDFGLDASLRWLTERFAERTGVDVEYQSDFNGRLRDDVETHLFRIAQEALTNIARHSAATRVHVELAERKHTLALVIADNGRGLPEQPAPAKPSIGLVGMRARARQAGGDVTIKSSAGTGVRIEVWVPALAEENATEESARPAGR